MRRAGWAGAARLTGAARRAGAAGILAAAAAAVSLAGCVTLETYVEGDGTAYTALPITAKSVFARRGLSMSNGDSLSIGGCSLDYAGKEAAAWSVGGVGPETLVRYYTFHGPDDAAGRPVEIRRERIVAEGSSSTMMVETTWAVVITGSAGERTEYPLRHVTGAALGPSGDNDDLFVTFRGAAGVVEFRRYESRNKNAPDSPYVYLTGFRALVNGEELGILAFYPPAFYKADSPANRPAGGAALDSETALFILAAWAAHAGENG